MLKRKTSYTRDELWKDFPALAAAFDELMEEKRIPLWNYWVMYCGKYTNSTGGIRRITIPTIISVLLEHGYDIKITVDKKDEGTIEKKL